MDCVGCDKCRLWGKVQTTGLATALKVLFEMDEKALEYVFSPDSVTHTDGLYYIVLATTTTYYSARRSLH